MVHSIGNHLKITTSQLFLLCALFIVAVCIFLPFCIQMFKCCYKRYSTEQKIWEVTARKDSDFVESENDESVKVIATNISNLVTYG